MQQPNSQSEDPLYANNEENNVFLKINRFEIEQNAVFIDFSKEQILSSIENFKILNIYQRVSLSKNIAAIHEVCNGHPLFHSFLMQLALDCEQIKTELIKYLRETFPKVTSDTDLQHLFIEPLIKLVNCSHLEVREDSSVLLTEITHKLTGKQRKQVIRLALQLQKFDDEQSKIISINLISKMTPDMSQEQTEHFFKGDYINIFKQSSVRVKREIIHSAAVIAKNVSKQFLNTEIIGSFFVEKCKEAVWGIRKSCVQIMPQLVVLTEQKKQQLAQILLHLTKDGNKIVKIAAHKIIPEFLANYNSAEVPEKLVNMYIHLMDNDINNLTSRDGEIGSKVAFYFPGVMLTLGASRWQIMKKLFNRLIFNKNTEVKMPIASSLHEISRIIGPELSKQYMFKALDVILKDSSDCLKLAAISHISQFVELFQQSIRQNLIDVFLVLQKDPRKWRIRYEIASQLNTLSKIYQTQTVFKYIFPISLKLCNDNVSEVRFKAATQMYYVIDNMKPSALYQEMALQSLRGFALSEKYIQRETFAWMVSSLYKLKLFSQKHMDLVLDLSKDKIVNVRISLAISISQILRSNQQGPFLFKQVIQNLRSDVEDVREYLE